MNTEINFLGKKLEKKKVVNFIKVSAKIGLILLIFISIFLLNHSVLLSPDDYNYTWVQGSNMKKISSLEDCLATAKFFYNNWTGRVIPHVLIGIFRNINSYIFEVVNTLVFVLFVTLIPKVLNKKSTFLSILSVFGYLAFSMMFGEKFAWISGALNYLWPSTFLLLLIYYFYNYFVGEKDINKLGKIAIVLYAFIVGFMHENTAFVGGAFFVCLCLFKIRDYLKFDKIKKITIALIFVSFCLGAFATIFAPGNFTRMDEVNAQFSLSFLQNYVINKNVIIITIMSIFVVFIVQNFELIKNEKIRCLSLNNLKKYDYSLLKTEILYFILPALIATLPMAFISYFPPRAFLAYELMFMIVLSKNVIVISEYFEKNDIIIVTISLLLTLVVFGRYSPSTLAQINYIIPYKMKITSQYEDAIKNGEKDVLVSKFDYLPWIHREDYINIDNFFPEFNSKMPTNVLIARFYGFDRITAVGENEYLIEIDVNTEGINPYEVVEKGTERNILTMEYDNHIRYCISKDKLGEYLLDCRENNLQDKILGFRVRSIDEEITGQVALNQLIITK